MMLGSISLEYAISEQYRDSDNLYKMFIGHLASVSQHINDLNLYQSRGRIYTIYVCHTMIENWNIFAILVSSC